MNEKLTVQERLKDLRKNERNLTLEQLAEATGLSRSTLGNYEINDFKDISPFSIVKLAQFYGVSTDYLMGLTEQKNHSDTALDELHLSDDAIEVLKNVNFNKRLLSEMLCHPNFQRMMLDAEIFVDRIADMRINDMNAVLEAVRQMELAKQEEQGQEQRDVYLRTLELGQVQEDEYFGHVISEDLTHILRDIREAHKTDQTTADQTSVVAEIQKKLHEAMSYEGSNEEKMVRIFLANLGIDYDAITKEQFVNLMEVLKLSSHLKSPINRRGKGKAFHSSKKRGKRK